jgi:hypothetical protein
MQWFWALTHGTDSGHWHACQWLWVLTPCNDSCQWPWAMTHSHDSGQWLSAMILNSNWLDCMLKTPHCPPLLPLKLPRVNAQIYYPIGHCHDSLSDSLPRVSVLSPCHVLLPRVISSWVGAQSHCKISLPWAFALPWVIARCYCRVKNLLFQWGPCFSTSSTCT